MDIIINIFCLVIDMEKLLRCEACNRPISHSGFCFPCNRKRKAFGQTKIVTRKEIVCKECGFKVSYSFIRCPECNERYDKPVIEKPLDVFSDNRLVSVFPFPSMRASQKEMMNDVAKAVAAGRHLIADAPTGLGKTVAVLFPSLEYAVANGKNIFFLTSRISQHKAAIETLKMMKDAGNKFSAVDIVGKKHLCSQDVDDMNSSMFNSYCHAMVKHKKCEFYKNSRSEELGGERGRIVRILASSIPGTEEAMNLASSRYCTYELLMDAARHADVIVGDYFHLFGMKDKFLKRMNKQLQESIIIVDEAHNLSGRLRDYLSSRISLRSCDFAAKEAADFTDGEARSIAKEIGKCLENMGKKIFNKKETFVLKAEFIDRINEIGSYDGIIEKLTLLGQRVLEEKKISHIDRIAEFLNMWKKDDFGYARILTRDKDHLVLQFNCMDPSLLSREVVKGSHSTILMSGTLSPMEMHRDLLGLEAGRTDMKSYLSPFPKENRLNIIATGITTKYKERTDENLSKIAHTTMLCINSIRGNTAVFFPSYDMRNKICSMIHVSKHSIMEKSDMTKKDRDSVKEELKKHSKEGAVLFGVMGGSFSEGIDLPGDLLNGVIIVGLPLDRPSLSSEALISYYDERFGRGRDYGYNFPAMIKVMQASGRCIRTEHDRGVIVFADERFTWQNYKRIFPKGWDFIATERPDIEIRKFFS